MNTTGAPVRIDFDSSAGPRSVVIKPGAVFDANFFKASNIVVEGKALFESELKNVGNILKSAVLLDYETGGKIGGSVITEATAYHMNDNVANLFYIKPYHTVNLREADFFEAASFTSKVGRRTVNIKTSVTPRSFASSFFTKHLSNIITGAFVGDTVSNMSAFNLGLSVTTDEDVRKIAANVLNNDITNKLELEESILKLDRQKDIFKSGPLRDMLLKHTAKVDAFQTRYYLNDLAEADRLGIRRHLFDDADSRQIHEILDYLKAERPASASELLNLQAKQERLLQERFGKQVSVNVEQVDIESFVYKHLPKQVEDRTVLASMLSFESKQTGAAIRGIIAEKLLKEDPSLIDGDLEQFNRRIERSLLEEGNPFESVIKGVSYTGDPFYTTGQEYNMDRALAQKHNTFSNLLTSFVKSTGVKDARDVIDLQKIVQGKVHGLGLQDIEYPKGMSVEVQSRLFGAAQEIMEGSDADKVAQKLLEKEAHISVADAAVSSPKIASNALGFAIAGQEFSEGTELGQHYYKQALNKQGPLYGLFAYAELSKQHFATRGADDLGLMDIYFDQRMARNVEKVVDSSGLQTFGNVEGQKFIQVPTYEVSEGGERKTISRTTGYAKTRSYKGIAGVYSSSKTVAKEYSGVDADVALNRLFERINKKEKFFEYNETSNQYRLPTRPTGLAESKAYDQKMGRLRNTMAGLTESNAEQIEVFERRLKQSSEQTSKNIESALKGVSVADTKGRTSVNVAGRSRLDRTIGAHETLKFAKKVIAPVMLGGLAMSALSSLRESQEPRQSSYLIPNYNDWFSAQAEMFGGSESFVRAMQEKTGYIEGMQEGGLSSTLRKMSSDFGSPYTGPGYSDMTLERNELLRARQRKLRHIYNQRHLQSTGDIKNMLSSFINKSFTPAAMSPMDSTRTLLSPGSAGASRYTSLKGRHLTRVDASNNYHIDVQDADTIALKRNYGSGGMKDFFFGRKNTQSMSIRLAGIDAPETAHQNRGAQPYAEAAKRIAADMISRAKNVEVVFDKGDSTYGRRVGMVYADGVNVNLELIKRGAAAYLPYRSHKSSPIYDTEEFRSAQETAYKSKRGMWRTDYFNSYKQIAQESGQTVTFNTLVNPSKVAGNTSLMTMYSAMKTAEAFGMQHTVAQQATVEAGLQLKERARSHANNIFKPDYMKNEWTEPNLMGTQQTNSILTGLDEIKYDLNNHIKTKGSSVSNKHSALNVKSLDLEMASETTSAKYNSFNKDYLFNAKDLNKKKQRLAAMQFLQQRQAQRMFNNNTGHHRM